MSTTIGEQQQSGHAGDCTKGGANISLDLGPSRQLDGDLGVGTPMTRPQCDGAGIVVVYSATKPASYAAEVSNALAARPGARYLRTDQSCPSLRQQSAEGNPIYAVYKPAGYTQVQVCRAVRQENDDAYGKWLDTTTDPTRIIPC